MGNAQRSAGRLGDMNGNVKWIVSVFLGLAGVIGITAAAASKYGDAMGLIGVNAQEITHCHESINEIKEDVKDISVEQKTIAVNIAEIKTILEK